MQSKLRKLKLISRHPSAVPFMTFTVLVLLTVGGYFLARQTNHLTSAPDAKIVIISHDHERQVVPSRDATVGALLTKIHLHLNQGDVVEPAADTPIDQDQFRINIYRAVPVEIVDGTQKSYTFSAATTPRSIAAQAGKTVYADDIVSTDPADNLLKTSAVGEQVVINRATPVNLNLYGSPVTLRTHAKTVADLVKQKNIVLAKDDQVVPNPDTPLTNGIQVFIVRNGTKIETITQQIAMPVQTISDPTLAYGTSAVRQQGSNGQQVITYQDTLKNGAIVGRAAIQTVVTQPAVTEIVVMGTSLSGIKGDLALAGVAPSDYTYADYIISHESGWNPAAHNASGTYGLCQALPGSKMASAGADWMTNPITQLKWCSGYAHSRYGSWYNAYVHWVSNRNW